MLNQYGRAVGRRRNQKKLFGFLLFLVLLAVGAVIMFFTQSVITPGQLLNQANPQFDKTARAELDAQAQLMGQTNQLMAGVRWQNLWRSPSAECHYRAKPAPEFVISGTLDPIYIQPHSNAPRWYVKFPENLDLFGGTGQIEAGVVTMQQFYYSIVPTGEGYKACDDPQTVRVRRILGL